MPSGFFMWSQTAASNATADTSVNYSEGQSPSSLNDSARAAMASLAKWRDDISGAITTGGSSTAYTVTSYSAFDSLAHMSGQMIGFVPHATNGATVTLNVDGLGAKPLRPAPSVELQAGVLIAGTPYTAVYNNSSAVWYLTNSYVNPYQVPLGGMLDYIGSTAPNAAFVLPIGQAISRTTYATLFSLISTTYGTGDGSTTFNVPDLTGRVTAMKEASATRLTSTYFVGDSTALGAVGGGESKTLITANLPAYTPAGTNSTSSVTFGTFKVAFNNSSTAATSGGGQPTGTSLGNVTGTADAQTFTGTAQGGTSTPFRTVQPTIVLNKILRVI
jgi:microcystin-dependent protein